MPALSTPPTPIFIAGLCSIPCIVFQPQLTVLVFQMGFCLFCAIKNGKKIKPLYFLLLIASVSFFHLLTPRGEVYFYLWRLPITNGALLTGIRKGLVVCTLVFCSLATVRIGIRLPTRIGTLLSTIFIYFDILFQQRYRLRRKSLLRDIDQLLHQLSATVTLDQSKIEGIPHYSRTAWLREVILAFLFFTVHLTSIIIARIV